MQGKEQRFI